MKKMMLIALCILVFAGLALAQNPTYTGGAVGLQGIDKLGAHQNGGRGCVGCHAPHSGARGNGGNAATGAPAVGDPATGNYALWGQDLTPLYNTITLATGDNGDFTLALPTAFSATDEKVITGVMMCLSCHDGNIARGAMMTNEAYEPNLAGFPAGYGPNPIPTLLGADGTANGNYQNDHPIGPNANLLAVGLVNSTATPPVARVTYSVGGCLDHGNPADCIQPNAADTAYTAFRGHYGSFNVTFGRTNPLVLPDTNPEHAYVVCTTCHTPHSMHVYSGTAAGVKGVYPTFFFVAAPYNPGAPVPDGTQASSATQFCRQCHFSGAGGSNEASGIMNVTTAF